MTRKPVAYISAPISNDPDYENVFIKTHKSLTSLGFEVQNPVEFTRRLKEEQMRGMSVKEKVDFLAGDLCWRLCMEKCVEVLPSCDVLILAESVNRFESKGVDVEKLLAHEKNIPVLSMTAPQKVKDFLNSFAKLQNSPSHAIFDVEGEKMSISKEIEEKALALYPKVVNLEETCLSVSKKLGIEEDDVYQIYENHKLEDHLYSVEDAKEDIANLKEWGWIK